MNYHNIKKVDILRLKLIWQIQNLQLITQEDLFSYLDYQAHTDIEALEVLGDLLLNSNFAKRNVSQIYDYLTSLLNMFYIKYQNFTYIEKQYIYVYLFLTSLCATNIPIFARIVYNYYKALPKLDKTNDLLQFLENEIKFSAIGYFIYLDKAMEILE